jgi:hypothetical protein
MDLASITNVCSRSPPLLQVKKQFIFIVTYGYRKITDPETIEPSGHDSIFRHRRAPFILIRHGTAQISPTMILPELNGVFFRTVGPIFNIDQAHKDLVFNRGLPLGFIAFLFFFTNSEKEQKYIA